MKINLVTVIAASFSIALLSGCTTSRGEYSGNIKDDSKPNFFTEEKTSVSEATDDFGSVNPSFAKDPNEIDDERNTPLLQQRVVYFDYDKSLIDTDYLVIINTHADYLVRNPDRYIILGGHADERGSNEYNLALGQRRADAVRDIMLSAGVSPSQIVDVISFGEERPSVRGQNEAAWAKNRRVEIRYTDE